MRALERLYHCRESIAFALSSSAGRLAEGERQCLEAMSARREQFIAAMEDDLNTADALAAVFELAREINTAVSASPSRELCDEMARLFDELCGVLGLLVRPKGRRFS